MQSNFDSSLPSPSNNENIVTKLLTIISANHETPISGSQVNEYLKSEEGKTFLSGYDRTQLLTLQDFLGEKSKIQVITENATRNFPPIIKQVSKLAYKTILFTGKALQANDIHHYKQALTTVNEKLREINQSSSSSSTGSGESSKRSTSDLISYIALLTLEEANHAVDKVINASQLSSSSASIEEVARVRIEQSVIPLDYRTANEGDVLNVFKKIFRDPDNPKGQTILSLARRPEIGFDNMYRLLNSRYTKNKSNKMRMVNALCDIEQYLKTNRGATNHYEKEKIDKAFGWSIDDKGDIYIRIKEQLGTGAYKKVSKQICINTMKEWASSSVSNLGKGDASRLAKQGEMFQKELIEAGVRHIVPPAKISYTSRVRDTETTKVVLTTRLFAGDALKFTESYLEKKEAVPVDDVYTILRDSAEGLADMHERGFIHGDFKTPNILLEKREDGSIEEAFLADFDGAGKIGSLLKVTTEDYCPPESLKRGVLRKTSAHDAFSLGVTAIDLLFGTPFPCDIFSRIDHLQATYPFTNSQEDLIGSILRPQDRRPLFDDLDTVLKTKYQGDDYVKAKAILDIAQTLLIHNRNKRATCEQAAIALKRAFD